jgi:thiamine-monophosphate kinase
MVPSMSSALRLSELGEFGLIRELARRGLAVGVGDDTAVLADGMVVTQDALVEEVHFRLDWITWRDLGYKAAAVNLSDLAAAGAEPEALIVSLGLPAETPVECIVELYEGLNEAGVPVRGGDTTRADRLYLSVTAIGRSERVPGRAGALVGDIVVVTGPLGGSAAGLRVLERGLAGYDDLVQAHRRPPFRLDAARLLAPVAHALIDLSDGIASDAGRIAEQSGCCLELEADRLPLFPRIAELGSDPFWTMGEDYELLAVLSADDVGRLDFPIVGECVEGSGVRLRSGDELLDVSGWDHFSPGG